jgi:limonene-1,2-epoxide hydrolase
MEPIEQAITGAQYSRCYASNPGSTPEAALEQFYAAFNGRDLALMYDNWAQTDEIALDNPLGSIRRGWNEIRPLYERVFSGSAVVYVEFYDYTLHVGHELC